MSPRFRIFFPLLLLANLLPVFCSLRGQTLELPAGFRTIEIQVEGTAREALVFAPTTAKKRAAPVVFVFHGHGGGMTSAARTFAMHKHWPAAISVYMQGLNTPGRLIDREGKKAGWQGRPGDQGDRDLKFFDAMLAKLTADYQVDEKRIYATGHSNGGGFTYLLWETRGQVLAAVAPSSAAKGRAAALTPKPAMHIAGKNDPLVKFQWQQASMEAIRKVNNCEAEGRPWARNCLIYDSKTDTPFVSFIHPGGHKFNPKAPALIAKFFKEH